MTETEASQSTPTFDGGQGSRAISPLARRAAALAIDGALIVAIEAGLGHVAFDLLMRLGRAGPLFGFVVMTAYFAVLNSRVGGGSLGKRLTGIEVVDRHGKSSGLLRSLGRTVVLTAPLFSGGWFLSTTTLYNFTGFWIRFCEVLIPLASIYLVVCDRRNRRGVHDWIAGTWVVTRHSPGRMPAMKTWWGHFAVVGLAACAFTFSFVQQRNEILPINFPGVPRLERNVIATHEEIEKSGVARPNSVGGTLIFPSHQHPEAAPIDLSVQWKTRPQDPEAAAAEIAAIVFRVIPEAATVDRIAITITFGYNIGFGRSHREHHFVKTPAQWQALLTATKK